MSELLKSIRIKSNNICYAPAPDDTDEVEQYLTIAANGRVWFSARNYQQYRKKDGFCRKKQISIGKSKAEFLLTLISNLADVQTYATDVGFYEIEFRYEDGRVEKTTGPLIGDVFSYAYGNNKDVDLTKLIRRYIPIFDLWVFDDYMFLDDEG